MTAKASGIYAPDGSLYITLTDGAGNLATTGGGTPGGTSGQLQYNSSSAFAGMSGTSWDNTNRSLSLTGATVTTSNPILNLTQTWNAGAVTFTGLKLNVTDTASAALSLLLDLQVAGSSVFKVTKAGKIIAGHIQNAVLATDGNTINIWNGGSFSFSSTPSPINAADVALWRDAAGSLAQRVFGANPQKFSTYNTYTDASNYGRLSLDAAKTTASVNRIMSEALGTGVVLPLAIDGYTMSGAPTTAKLPAGSFGVFKDSAGGGVVIAYNDGGTIKTAALT